MASKENKQAGRGCPSPRGSCFPSKSHLARVVRDNFVRTKGVAGLGVDTFKRFLTGKDMVLVMFYDPCNPMSVWSKGHFAQAAERTTKGKRSYAAVDCTSERELCSREHATGLPFFRLYSRGETVGSVRDVKRFVAKEMVKYVETTPVGSRVEPPLFPMDACK